MRGVRFGTFTECDIRILHQYIDMVWWIALKLSEVDLNMSTVQVQISFNFHIGASFSAKKWILFLEQVRILIVTGNAISVHNLLILKHHFMTTVQLKRQNSKMEQYFLGKINFLTDSRRRHQQMLKTDRRVGFCVTSSFMKSRILKRRLFDPHSYLSFMKSRILKRRLFDPHSYLIVWPIVWIWYISKYLRPT